MNAPPQGAERAPRRVASPAFDRPLLDRVVPGFVERHADVSVEAPSRAGSVVHSMATSWFELASGCRDATHPQMSLCIHNAIGWTPVNCDVLFCCH